MKGGQVALPSLPTWFSALFNLLYFAVSSGTKIPRQLALGFSIDVDDFLPISKTLPLEKMPMSTLMEHD